MCKANGTDSICCFVTSYEERAPRFTLGTGYPPRSHHKGLSLFESPATSRTGLLPKLSHLGALTKTVNLGALTKTAHLGALTKPAHLGGLSPNMHTSGLSPKLHILGLLPKLSHLEALTKTVLHISRYFWLTNSQQNKALDVRAPHKNEEGAS